MMPPGAGAGYSLVVPDSTLDALRAAEDAAEADKALEEPGDSIALEDLEAEFSQ
jgi:hypothetical protein